MRLTKGLMLAGIAVAVGILAGLLASSLGSDLALRGGGAGAMELLAGGHRARGADRWRLLPRRGEPPSDGVCVHTPPSAMSSPSKGTSSPAVSRSWGSRRSSPCSRTRWSTWGALAALLKYNVRRAPAGPPTSWAGQASPSPPTGSPTGAPTSISCRKAVSASSTPSPPARSSGWNGASSTSPTRTSRRRTRASTSASSSSASRSSTERLRPSPLP